MVTRDELAMLLASESDRIEFKESPGQRDPILQAVCALANDLSDSRRTGCVIVGADKHGRIVGVQGDASSVDEVQRVLADRIRSSKIQPVPSTSVEAVEQDGRTLILIQIAPYPVPPVVEVDGVAWVRVGTTTRRANEADLQRLRERRPERHQPFDTRLCHGCSLDDLETSRLRPDWESAKELDEHNESFPSFLAWLTQRQFGRVIDGAWTPNAAAVLIRGKGPQDVIPCAVIDMVRYGGLDRDATVVARRTATGTIPDQLDVAWNWLATQIDSVPGVAEGLREVFLPRYPLDALKELVRNLAQHRSYEGTNAPGRIEWFDDRIEFSNPGRPFGRASEGEFGSHSDYRNPLITKLLVELGYVQQLGRGIRRVRLLLQQNGNPPLSTEIDGFTRVTVRSRT
ncbi:MAG: putative DNA binding domain-containing protein [Planctomycetes bacterium]|nr:putative DNA binding domain-containing protein [Planctomycetota bacterium]